MKKEIQKKLGDLLSDATDEENAGRRSDFLDRYLAEPYGDEVEGRSRFVDSSASDAVDAILTEVVDVFTSTDQVLEFTPVGEEDEESAKQETATVSHIFWQKNPGFEIIYTWMKEALIQQNAYCWFGWSEKERVEIEEYEDLAFEEYLQIVSELTGDYEIQEQTGIASAIDPETGFEIPVPDIGEDGQPAPISVRIRCIKRDKEYLIEPFPQEDFFITPRWGKIGLDGVPLCGRRHRDKTKEDWLAFGFSEASVEKLTAPDNSEEETSARHDTRDSHEGEATAEYLELYEVYANIDMDGDGTAELVRVWCNEDATTVMEWSDGSEAAEEVSHIPIAGWTPYLMPHRHIGRGVVENVDDIQLVKTVLIRQMLDNVYSTNYPRPVYDENEAGENLENDLLNPKPGALVRTGGAVIEWSSPPPVFAATMPLLEKFDALQEQRTGSTRYNQGLDAETLNKTATGIDRILGASQKKAKLIARTFAETGLRALFLGIHRDLRNGPMREIAMRMRGQWAYVNPRTWKHRTDMVVNVGMGRGDRDERRMALMQTGQVQRELIAAGSRMVDESKLFATIDDTLETFGVSGAEKYFYDPSKLPPPPPPAPPPPDPIMISAQAQAQKFAADAQRDAARLQAEERERERQFQVKMQELRLRELELTNKITNERETLELRQNEAVMKDDLERDKMAVTGAPAVPYGQVTGDTR